MQLKYLYTQVFSLLIIFNSFSQNVNVKGIVVSHLNNKPIENVSVKIGNMGCITNSNGEFILSVDERKLAQDVITFSCIGYIAKKIQVKNADTLITIKLNENPKVLAEVTVSSGAREILKKAIESIDVNYPTKPFIQNGVMRIIFTQDNGYFYNNDAFLEIYTHSYKKRDESDVRLIKNKLNVLTGAYYDSASTLRLVQYYNTVSTCDFVHDHSPFINLNSMKYFTYILKPKECKYNRKVYVIDFVSHDDIKGVQYKKIEGTLYIDTATYAFIEGDFVSYHIKEFLFTPIKECDSKVIYYNDSINDWHLKEMNRKVYYNTTNNINSQSTIDFLSTSIGINNASEFSYENTIQKTDVVQNTNKIADSTEWAKYDSLFVKAEKDSSINHTPEL